MLNDEYIKRSRCMKSVMLFFIITCLLLCACNDKKDLENTIKFPRNSNKAIEVTQFPHNDLKFDKKEDKELEEYDDSGSYLFWSEKLTCNKKEIDDLVDWIKNINYCTSISFDFGAIRIEPDSINKEIRKENEFNKIIKIIYDNEYTIINDWSNGKKITILHRFDFENLSGNYCLIYTKNKIKKSKEKYKEICQNYYSDVIYYDSFKK